jgi:hypothetical protein
VRLAVIALASMLSGCAVMSQDLVSQDGSKVQCYNVGFGIIGAPIAVASQFACVRDAEKAGYAKVN